MKGYAPKLIIKISEDLKEAAYGWLNFAEVDAILETEEGLTIYKEGGELEPVINVLKECMAIPASDMTIEYEKNVNWNSAWEANFNPLLIGDIYVRAAFHDPHPKAKIDLLISPKMAFGTGHHETTHLMLDHMQSISFKERKVLDYGCGTGILSVLAKMKGSRELTCIDIQKEAIENTNEHFEINGYNPGDNQILLGDLDKLGSSKFDIILANINRHVLLNQFQNLHQLLLPDGMLIISGILKSDRETILESYTADHFELFTESSKGEWTRMTFTRK